jgi:hypothetical protein
MVRALRWNGDGTTGRERDRLAQVVVENGVTTVGLQVY